MKPQTHYQRPKAVSSQPQRHSERTDTPQISTAQTSTTQTSTAQTSPTRQPRNPNKISGDTLRYIGGLFLATRLVLTLVGMVAHAQLPTDYGKQISWSPHLWLDLWGVWDSAWYMDIAQNGYSTEAFRAEFPEQTNFPFFPLYPLLMRGIGWVIGDPYLAGLLISNICLLLSAYLLYRLVEADSNRTMAKRAVKYLFIYPVSFILSGVFTESLYLCLSLLCFFWAKRQRWGLAGLVGMFLSATRPLGVLILLPLLVEYWQRPRVISEAGRRYGFDDRPRRLGWRCLWLGLVPLGLLSFCVYNYHVTGDFLFFKTNQTAWDREFGNPLGVMWEALTVGVSEPSFKKLLEVAFGGITLVGLTAFYKRIGLAYWLLGMYSLLIPLSSGIASQPRFTLVVFPVFVVLAQLGRQRQWDRGLTVGLGVLQGVLMVFWCTGFGLVV